MEIYIVTVQSIRSGEVFSQAIFLPLQMADFYAQDLRDSMEQDHDDPFEIVISEYSTNSGIFQYCGRSGTYMPIG